MVEINLDTIRQDLIRLEETIIFALIERAQFRVNVVTYQPGAFGPELGGASLLDHILRETEISHARLRRYLAPEEHPFTDGLPDPLLPPLNTPTPLHRSAICINAELRTTYIDDIIPFVCEPGEDQQFGSSAVCDVAALQALSKRVHYGMFVAESKYRESKETFQAAIDAADRDQLMKLITHQRVEDAVIARIHKKATTYTAELRTAPVGFIPDPAAIATIYQRWIIPLNKEVQIAYLLEKQAR